MSAGQAWNNARRVLLVDVNNNALVTQPGNADDQPATDRGLVVNSRLHLFDGTNWDRAKAKANGWPGFALVRSSDGTELLASDAADSISDIGQIHLAANRPQLYNGSTYDRQRGNTEGTLLASASRTTTATSPTQTNHNARGVLLVLSVTVASGTGGLTVRVFGQAGASGSAGMNAVPTAVTATGNYFYLFYPGAATTGMISTMQISSGALPRSWYAAVAHSDASIYTYSLEYGLIV